MAKIIYIGLFFFSISSSFSISQENSENSQVSDYEQVKKELEDFLYKKKIWNKSVVVDSEELEVKRPLMEQYILWVVKNGYVDMLNLINEAYKKRGVVIDYRSVRNTEKNNVLHLAEDEVLEWLFKNLPEETISNLLNTKDFSFNEDGNNPGFVAAKDLDLEKLKKLVKDGKLNLEQKNEEGKNILDIAIHHTNSEDYSIIEYLIKQETPIEIDTIRELAFSENSLLYKLISLSEDLIKKTPNDIVIQIYNNLQNLIKDRSLSEQDKKERKIIYTKIMYLINGHTASVGELIKTVKENDLEKTEDLFNKNKIIINSEEDGSTPMHHIQSKEMLDLLYKKGGDLFSGESKEGGYPWQTILKNSPDLDLIKSVVQKVQDKLKEEKKELESYLHYVIQNPNKKILVSFFSDENNNIEQKDLESWNEGVNLLHRAIENESPIEVLLYLLKKIPKSINQQQLNKDQDTPLHLLKNLNQLDRILDNVTPEQVENIFNRQGMLALQKFLKEGKSLEFIKKIMHLFGEKIFLVPMEENINLSLVFSLFWQAFEDRKITSEQFEKILESVEQLNDSSDDEKIIQIELRNRVYPNPQDRGVLDQVFNKQNGQEENNSSEREQKGSGDDETLVQENNCSQKFNG